MTNIVLLLYKASVEIHSLMIEACLYVYIKIKDNRKAAEPIVLSHFT